MYVKDSITGVGTLTYIDPNTKIFGALGHEIADSTTKEILNINNYVEKSILVEMSNYKIIVHDNQKIGCLLVTKKENSMMLDEIYLEEEYRNKKIGTNIITNILKSNSLIYLWVYKENTKAISLYKKMKFKVINETETRYYMEYSK